MCTDFSAFNVQSLTLARDVMRQYPDTGATLLAFPEEQAHVIASLSAKDLATFSRVKPLLFVPRPDPVLWSRLLIAIREGHASEINAITAHFSLMMTSQGGRR